MSLNLSIKAVPEALAARLRARAQRNHRSLQGELMAIIEQAANEGPDAGDPAGGLAGASPPAQRREPLRRGQSFRRGHRRIEDIAAELRAQYPQPVSDVPKAVDIIRELRDRR